MANLNPIETYISVSEVFPDTKNDFYDFVHLLKTLSKTDSIFWCARLNIVLSSTALTQNEKQQFCVSQLLSAEDIKILNDAVTKKGKKSALLFFRRQILELLRWILLYCNDSDNDGNTFEDIETRRTFAKALLISSNIWGEQNFKIWHFDGEDIETQRKMVLGSVRKSIEATQCVPPLETTFGRGWVLFNEYLRIPEHPDGDSGNIRTRNRRHPDTLPAKLIVK